MRTLISTTISRHFDSLLHLLIFENFGKLMKFCNFPIFQGIYERNSIASCSLKQKSRPKIQFPSQNAMKNWLNLFRGRNQFFFWEKKVIFLIKFRIFPQYYIENRRGIEILTNRSNLKQKVWISLRWIYSSGKFVTFLGSPFPAHKINDFITLCKYEFCLKKRDLLFFIHFSFCTFFQDGEMKFNIK